MRVFKALTKHLMVVALALSFVPAAVPSGTPLLGVTVAKADSRHHFRGGRHYRGGHHRSYRHGGYRRGNHRYYGNRRYYRRGGNGAAVAAGIIGLGVGAAIAGSSQPRYYGGSGLSARDRACLARYRSYDPRSNTYQPHNGPRRICR